jgi:hypothetical protein
MLLRVVDGGDWEEFAPAFYGNTSGSCFSFQVDVMVYLLNSELRCEYLENTEDFRLL